LIGERGPRSNRNSFEDIWSEEGHGPFRGGGLGLRRLTADAPARAMLTHAFAEFYRDQGHSVWRDGCLVTASYAQAQREKSLAGREPGDRAYPPSVFAKCTSGATHCATVAARCGSISGLHGYCTKATISKTGLLMPPGAILDAYCVVRGGWREKGHTGDRC